MIEMEKRLVVTHGGHGGPGEGGEYKCREVVQEGSLWWWNNSVNSVELHTHIELMSMSWYYQYYSSSVTYNHWEKLSEGHIGPLCTGLVIFCESIIISK